MKNKTKCVYCGKEIGEHDKYCKYCGMENKYFDKQDTLEKATKGEIDNPNDINKYKGRLLGLFLGPIGVLITHKLFPKEDKTYKDSITFAFVSTTLILLGLIILFFVLLHLKGLF